jgi:peptidoglycan/LPS O-acetylase OafA/YrhL
MLQTARSAPERFAGLDLLRGIAALGVLSVHLPWPARIPAPFPRGYLAVDLFFVLSGFVISHAYSQRLGTRKQFYQYGLARLIRLYPLYCAATFIAAGEVLAFAWFGHGGNANMTVARLIPSMLTGLLFLPTPSNWSVAPASFFPLVFPAWSLFWELWVNLVYGVIPPRLRAWAFALLIALGAAGLAVALSVYGEVSLGESWRGALTGAAQASFCFFVGCALFHLRKRYAAPATPVLLLAAVLLLSFVPGKFGGWAYDLSCMILLYPALVWLAANAAMSSQLRAVGDFVGFLSYPVYVLQIPFLLWLAPISVRVERYVPTDGAVAVIIDAVAILAGSWVLARTFDSPTRDRLRRRIVPQAPIPRAQTAP